MEKERTCADALFDMVAELNAPGRLSSMAMMALVTFVAHLGLASYSLVETYDPVATCGKDRCLSKFEEEASRLVQDGFQMPLLSKPRDYEEKEPYNTTMDYDMKPFDLGKPSYSLRNFEYMENEYEQVMNYDMVRGIGTLQESRIGASLVVERIGASQEQREIDTSYENESLWIGTTAGIGGEHIIFYEIMVTLAWFLPYFMLAVVLVIVTKYVLACKRENKVKRIFNRGKQNHLSQQKRKWNGCLRSRWRSRMRLRSAFWIFLYANSVQISHAMDAAQVQQLMTRVMGLSAAATTAAQISTNVLKKFEESQADHGHKPRFGDGAKVLKSPDCFEVDDPIRYSLWKEQFTNWLVFCDARYAALLEEAEGASDVANMVDFTDESKDLGLKLYSILSSYLRGPSLQIVRSHAKDQCGKS